MLLRLIFSDDDGDDDDDDDVGKNGLHGCSHVWPCTGPHCGKYSSTANVPSKLPLLKEE